MRFTGKAGFLNGSRDKSITPERPKFKGKNNIEVEIQDVPTPESDSLSCFSGRRCKVLVAGASVFYLMGICSELMRSSLSMNVVPTTVFLQRSLLAGYVLWWTP